MDKTTYFTTAEPASPLRKLAAYVLDFLVSMILMIGLFAIEEAIANNTPSVLENQTKMNEIYQDMRSLTQTSKLAQADGEGYLLGQSDIVENYIYGATYQSLKMNQDETLTESVYEGYDPITSENDNCYYYYVIFKTENNDSFIDETAKANAGITYYQEQFSEYLLDDYYEWIDDYPYLKLDVAKDINEYFLRSTYTTGYNIYTRITNTYSSLLSSGVTEMQTYYQPYLDLMGQLEEYSSFSYDVKSLELIIAYLVSFALYFVLLPILLKDGRTLAFKVMTMGVVNYKQVRLKWYNYLIRFVMHVIEEICIISVVALIFFGSDGVELIGRELFGSVSFLSAGLLSMLLMMVDYFFSFAMRHTSQTLSEFISQEIVKDGKMFDVVKKKDLNEE